MKLTLAILACLLLTPIASAEPLSWFWRVDNYRVPLPQSHLAGYALIVERVNIHNGDVSMAQQVSGSPIYASIIACSKAQMGRIERPDASGFVKTYFCRALYRWPAGTGVL